MHEKIELLEKLREDNKKALGLYEELETSYQLEDLIPGIFKGPGKVTIACKQRVISRAKRSKMLRAIGFSSVHYLSRKLSRKLVWPIEYHMIAKKADGTSITLEFTGEENVHLLKPDQPGVVTIPELRKEYNKLLKMQKQNREW